MESIHEILENEAEKESRTKILHVIDAYDEVLSANKELDAKYKAEEEVMIKRLKEVQVELQQIKRQRDERRNQSQIVEKKESYTYYIVGKPYFKDRNFNFPPDNEDTKIMKQLKMYDFSNVMTVAGWTVGDRSRLLSALFELATNDAKTKIHQEIALLKRVDVKSPTILNKITQLKQQLAAMKTKKLEDLDLKGIEFDWEDIAYKLNRRHTPKEYQSIWTLFFHPKVNKSKWSSEEHRELQILAKERKMQDWDSIARDLNTNRTGYQCFVYYRTNMDQAASGRRWSPPEIENLRRVVSLYKEDNFIPWGKVAAAMSNRTKIQCYNKYIRLVEARKGRFLPEEDSVILNFAEVYGPDYRQMTQYLYGRSSIQLRVRHRLLQQGVSATWTHEDDKKLLQVVANQDSSATFSAATKHFPGKDRLQLRSRYNCLVRWMRRHPAADTRHAPRRAARRLAHGEPTRNLITAIRNLRDKMNEIVDSSDKQKRKHNRLSRDSSHKHIQDSILSTLSLLEIKRQMSESRAAGAAGGAGAGRGAAGRGGARDVARLRHALLLLNADLHDWNDFYNSEIGSQLRLLAESEEAPRLVVSKYYGRGPAPAPAPAPALAPAPAPAPARCVFPPHFATLTGARVILTQLSKSQAEPPTAGAGAVGRARGGAARGALATLRSRFNDLFMWPYVLSNEPPCYYEAIAKEQEKMASLTNCTSASKRQLPSAPAVTIPSGQRRQRMGRLMVQRITTRNNPLGHNNELTTDHQTSFKDDEKLKTDKVRRTRDNMSHLMLGNGAKDKKTDEPDKGDGERENVGDETDKVVVVDTVDSEIELGVIDEETVGVNDE